VFTTICQIRYWPIWGVHNITAIWCYWYRLSTIWQVLHHIVSNILGQYDILRTILKPQLIRISPSCLKSSISSSWMPLSSLSPSTSIWIFNHDFKHSKASIVKILRRFRRSEIVIFAPEKRRSGLADIAGIDNILEQEKRHKTKTINRCLKLVQLLLL
jgi:hypothetical protein